MIPRCCLCGKDLSNPKSVERGIGPDCNKNSKEDRSLLTTLSDKLDLPCNHYDCEEGSCPFATFKRCPRMRVYIRKDVYPLYDRKKMRECSFCGKKLANGNYTKKVYKSKIVLECFECKQKNKTWRQNKNGQMSIN